MATTIDRATRDRLAKLAAQRTPAVVQAELAAIEAGYAEEAAIRKAEALRNVEKWTAIRKARGAAK